MNSFFTLPDHGFTLSSFTALTPAVQSHVASVYSQMAIMFALSSVTASFFPMNGFFPLIVTLGALFAFQATDEEKNPQRARASLYAFALAKGAAIGPLVQAVAHVDASMIVTALVATTALFVCFSLSVLSSPSRSMFYVAGMWNYTQPLQRLRLFVTQRYLSFKTLC